MQIFVKVLDGIRTITLEVELSITTPQGNTVYEVTIFVSFLNMDGWKKKTQSRLRISLPGMSHFDLSVHAVSVFLCVIIMFFWLLVCLPFLFGQKSLEAGVWHFYIIPIVWNYKYLLKAFKLTHLQVFRTIL